MVSTSQLLETRRRHLQNNLWLENVLTGDQYLVHSHMQEDILHIYSESRQLSFKLSQLGVKQKHSI